MACPLLVGYARSQDQEEPFMKNLCLQRPLVLCASALLLPVCAHAQGEPVVLLESPLTQKSVVYSQQELDAMLAPIALYPRTHCWPSFDGRHLPH